MYTANIHAIYRKGSDAGVNLLFESIGKSYRVNQVEISIFGNVCNSIELNDHGSNFIQSANLPAGIENHGI